MWRTCPSRLNPPSRVVLRRGDVLMDRKFGSDRGSHCSKSARQRQYPKRLKRVQASTRAKMLRRPSKKRPPGATPLVRLPCFLRCCPSGSLTSPTRQHPYIKGCGQDSPKVHNQHEINDLVKDPKFVPHPTNATDLGIQMLGGRLFCLFLRC